MAMDEADGIAVVTNDDVQHCVADQLEHGYGD